MSSCMLLCECWESHSGPHACVTNTFQTGLSSISSRLTSVFSLKGLIALVYIFRTLYLALVDHCEINFL